MFTRYGGSLAAAGAVSYLFKARGLIVVDRTAIAEDALLELALEAGADDVSTEGDAYEVLTPPSTFEAVREALAARSVAVQSAEVTKLASVQVALAEKDAGSVLGSSRRSRTTTTCRRSTRTSSCPTKSLRSFRNSPSMRAMRVLGLDPGSRRTGWGVVDRSGNVFRCVEYGWFAPASAPGRCRSGSTSSRARRARSSTGSRRTPWWSRRPSTTRACARPWCSGTCAARCMVAAVERGIEVAEYTPREIKLAVAGNGGAAKEQVAAMVRRILGTAGHPAGRRGRRARRARCAT